MLRLVYLSRNWCFKPFLFHFDVRFEALFDAKCFELFMKFAKRKLPTAKHYQIGGKKWCQEYSMECEAFGEFLFRSVYRLEQIAKLNMQWLNEVNRAWSVALKINTKAKWDSKWEKRNEVLPFQIVHKSQWFLMHQCCSVQFETF